MSLKALVLHGEWFNLFWKKYRAPFYDQYMLRFMISIIFTKAEWIGRVLKASMTFYNRFSSSLRNLDFVTGKEVLPQKEVCLCIFFWGGDLFVMCSAIFCNIFCNSVKCETVGQAPFLSSCVASTGMQNPELLKKMFHYCV